MCKFIVVFKNNKADTKIDSLLSANVNALKKEPHGFSLLSVNDKKLKVARSLNYNKMPNSIGVCDMFAIHTRTATTGTICEKNTHLHCINNRYYYAHNGFVMNYQQGTNDTTDSHAFFNAYFKKYDNITAKTLGHFIDKKSFSGRGFIYDVKTKKSYLFSTNELNIYAIDTSLVFSTYKLSFSVTKNIIKTVRGYDFVTTEKIKLFEPDNKDSVKNKLITLQDGKIISSEDFPAKKFPLYNSNYYQSLYSYNKFKSLKSTIKLEDSFTPNPLGYYDE